MSLRRVIGALERHYGRVDAPLEDPFQWILWENVAYLVDDARRLEAFQGLKAKVGLRPRDILAAKRAQLVEAIRAGGMKPEMRAEKLVRAAQLAEDVDAPLSEVVQRPVAEARKVLKRFPGIGEPGADKVLVLSRARPMLGLESNGLRVLVRLGFGREHPQSRGPGARSRLASSGGSDRTSSSLGTRTSCSASTARRCAREARPSAAPALSRRRARRAPGPNETRRRRRRTRPRQDPPWPS